jgi:iron complex outermembrane receptor protein
MKQIILFCMLFACIAPLSIQAANDLNGSLSGSVIDKNLQEPLPYVTITVQDTTSELLMGGITDDNGNFKISDIPEGTYKVTFQFIGYKSYTVPVTISTNSKNIDLGVAQLEEDVASLDEVTVTAERTTIQQKLDRKVITVGKDLTTAGPTAADIMNNLPSVNVDQQTGDISLRGNQNVRVMVDGKLTNVPVAQLLKQIPSNSIKQIELITNPSAKYNPEGMSGIINIILKKNTMVGFNGNANVGLTYEEEAKFNSAIDMNYRNGKFNFFGNWGHTTSKNQNNGNVFRPQDNSEQLFDILDKEQSNLFKVGVDFYLNDNNTISIFTNQNLFEGGTDGLTSVLYYDDPFFNQEQLFRAVSDNRSSQYNFDYKLDFEKEGHNIELEADYNTFTDDQDIDFDFTGNSFLENYEDASDTNRDRLTVNLDYVNPLNETTKLELGVQALLFDTNIDYNSTGTSLNSQGALVPSPSTDFQYKRDIYSAYATYGKSFEKWSVQLGARLEQVDVKADTNTVRAFTNDYVQVYPSAFATYNPSEKNQYQVSYSRRVDRPGISQVNPIREFTTPFISAFGNTQLEPQFTNSIEFNYTRSLEKGSITGGVFYRAIEDEINRALFVDRNDINRVILTYDNFDNTNAYGFELSGNYKPTKWWNFNASFDLYNQTQTGISEFVDTTQPDPSTANIITQTVGVENTAWNFRIFNNFKVTKELTLSAFGLYRGRNRTLQFDIEPMYFVNVGARYSLWEGRGTFSINYNDIFNTMQFAFDGIRPYPQTGAFNWESNTVNVALAYRFGGGKYRAKSRKRRDDNEKDGSGGVF